MLNIMKADFYRIVRSKGIYIGVALMLGMLALYIYTEPSVIGLQDPSSGIGLQLSVNVGDGQNSEEEQIDDEQLESLSIKDLRELGLKTKGYYLDRDLLATNMDLYWVFIFVASIAVASDFSGSCVKNTLSSAISRKRYFMSKWIFVMLGCVILFLFNNFAGYFGNLLFNGSGLASDFGSIVRITLLQLPPILALAGILTGFAFLFKRKAAFHAVVIPFIIVWQTLLEFLKFVLKLPEEVMSYELQGMITQLTLEPSVSYILKSYAVCAGIIVLFGAAGWLSFRKAEIK